MQHSCTIQNLELNSYINSKFLFIFMVIDISSCDIFSKLLHSFNMDSTQLNKESSFN